MVGHAFLPSSRFYSGTGLPTTYWAGFAKYNIAKSSLEAFVGFGDAMKKFFGTFGNATPPDATRLSATSENLTQIKFRISRRRCQAAERQRDD
jgi:hypothetical protein